MAGTFCEQHEIDADYRHDGWLWTATNDAQLGAWTSTVAALERHGEWPLEPMDRTELAWRSGSPAHIGGVFERTAATVQPALLARGLARVARESGVTVFEGSPMVALERSTPLRVRTVGGRVTADRVVLAMNAWAGQLRELRRALVIVSSDIVISEPVSDALRGGGWRDGMSISDSRLMVQWAGARAAAGPAGGAGSVPRRKPWCAAPSRAGSAPGRRPAGRHDRPGALAASPGGPGAAGVALP